MTVTRHVALVVALVLLSACNRTTAPPSSSAPPAPTIRHPAAHQAPDAMAPFDARFIDGMIRHHEGAVVMAREALIRGEHAEIKQLARAIVDSQQQEIDQMKAWRSAWYPTLASTDGMVMSGMAGMNGMHVAAGTSGVAHVGDMTHATGASATAGPYDLPFIDAMIPHHQGAISMAKQALAESERAEIRQLATAILEAQQKEIDQMTGWRQSWYN